MGIGAVLAEVTGQSLLEELAYLRLVVVVWYVEHLHLHFNGQWLSKERDNSLVKLFAISVNQILILYNRDLSSLNLNLPHLSCEVLPLRVRSDMSCLWHNSCPFGSVYIVEFCRDYWVASLFNSAETTVVVIAAEIVAFVADCFGLVFRAAKGYSRASEQGWKPFEIQRAVADLPWAAAD